MFMFTVENHVQLSLISLTVSQSTCYGLAVILCVYLYIIHVRKHPLPRSSPDQIDPYGHVRNGRERQHGDHRGARRALRRTSIFRRFAAGLRTREQQRARPEALPPPLPVPEENSLWLPFSTFWLPERSRQRVGNGRLGVERAIQPPGVETRRKRSTQQRLLE